MEVADDETSHGAEGTLGWIERMDGMEMVVVCDGNAVGNGRMRGVESVEDGGFVEEAAPVGEVAVGD